MSARLDNVSLVDAFQEGRSDKPVRRPSRILVPDESQEGQSHQAREAAESCLPPSPGLAKPPSPELIERALASDDPERPPDLSMLFSWRPRSADGCSKCPGHLKNEAHEMRGHLRARPHSAVELRRKSKASMKSSSPRSTFESAADERETLSRPRSASSIRGVNARSRLGYASGLPRSSQVESRFPRYVSDINNVIEHMKALEKSERAKIAADEAREKEKFQERNMEITRHKDLCVLKFHQDGTRLMVKRWSKGFVIHPPKERKPRLDLVGRRGPPGSPFGQRGQQGARIQPL